MSPAVARMHPLPAPGLGKLCGVKAEFQNHESINVAAVRDYCRSLPFKTIVEATANFGDYETAELNRMSHNQPSTARTLRRAETAVQPATLETTRLLSGFPSGAIVIGQRPLVIAGDWQGVPARVRAWQRGLKCMGNLLCMGLFLRFRVIPSPPDAPTTPTTARPPAWTWTCSVAPLGLFPARRARIESARHRAGFVVLLPRACARV
jgi:hypothetical protein